MQRASLSPELAVNLGTEIAWQEVGNSSNSSAWADSVTPMPTACGGVRCVQGYFTGCGTRGTQAWTQTLVCPHLLWCSPAYRRDNRGASEGTDTPMCVDTHVCTHSYTHTHAHGHTAASEPPSWVSSKGFGKSDILRDVKKGSWYQGCQCSTTVLSLK